MLTSIKTFLKSILIYLLLTSPSLLLAIMYFLSAFYAITFGWIAWIFFYCALLVCSYLSISQEFKLLLIISATAAGIFVAYFLIGFWLYDMNVLKDYSFVLFPIAAFVSAIAGILINRKKIIAYINNIHNEEVESLAL